MSNRRWVSFLIYGLDLAILITLDQLVKIWAVNNLQNQPVRPLIRGFLQLTYLENTGAAFGFLAGFGGSNILLTVVKLIIIAAAFMYFVKLPAEPRFTLLRIPLVLMVAGGIGNLIDRMRVGFVIDMFEFMFINFPVFNMADIYVTIGSFSFVLMVIFVVKDAPLFGAKTPNANS